MNLRRPNASDGTGPFYRAEDVIPLSDIVHIMQACRQKAERILEE